MLTREDAPWVDYLEIDEETNERKLISGTPDDVKKAYHEHQRKIKEYSKDETKIPK